MSRILWLSNAPWCGSGYGEQTALFVPRLAEQGHDVAVLCNFGLHSRETHWNGVTCYPSDGLWGNVHLATFADEHRADQVIALCDAWVLKPETWPEGLNAAVWTPVDHWPIPPQVLAVLQHERIQPIAMSRFGYELMQRFQLDPLYVPHGVNGAMFRPQPELRETVRAQLEIPADVFLIGMVAANTGNPSVPRKSFPQAFLAFAEFARRHEDAWLYVHTVANPGLTGGGLALDRLAEATSCPPGRLRFPHAKAFQLGIPQQALAYIYQAFDVLLMPSMGEGFGIPLIEAQACGVPVIASDHSAMSELAQNGFLVEGDPWWDELQESFFIAPHLRSILDRLEQAYEARGDQELRAAAAAFAADYDANLIAEEHWRPALDELLAPASGSAPSLRGSRTGSEVAA